MEFEGCCRVNVDGLHWQLPQMKDENPNFRLNISNVHFSSVNFLFYVGDNALLMFWWGVGTKTTWLGLGKDHVLSAQSRLETVSHFQMLKRSLYCSHSFVHDIIHTAEFHWDTCEIYKFYVFWWSLAPKTRVFTLCIMSDVDSSALPLLFSSIFSKPCALPEPYSPDIPTDIFPASSLGQVKRTGFAYLCVHTVNIL